MLVIFIDKRELSKLASTVANLIKIQKLAVQQKKYIIKKCQSLNKYKQRNPDMKTTYYYLYGVVEI